MIEEGELYKRVYQFVFNAIMEVSSGSEAVIKLEAEKETKAILAEAKKEFPDWHNEPSVIADELSDYTLWQNCLRKLKEIDVWHKKWFGEAP